MGTVTLDQVWELAKQLSPEEQRELAARLPVYSVLGASREDTGARRSLEESQAQRTAELRASLERQVARLKALRESGAPLEEPLMGKWNRPGLDLSWETLRADIRQIRDQWKEDFDDLDDDP